MKQTKEEILSESKKILEVLKEERGGSVLSFHEKVANDPYLLQAFLDQYKICNKDLVHIPRKYRELILMALGCALRSQTTVDVHAKLALEHGSSVEEIGEVFRLVFLLAGASALIPAVEIFEEIEY